MLELKMSRRYSFNYGLALVGLRDTSSLTLACLRDKVSVVAQDIFIIDGTVRENIDFSANHSDDAIWETLEAVQVNNVSGVVELTCSYYTAQTRHFCLS